MYLLLSPALAASHLFILSGQSNMENWEPKKKFLPTLKKELKPDTFWHVKVAHGGKSIRRWVPTWDTLAREHQVPDRPKSADADYYQEILNGVQAGIEEHGKPDTVTLVWAQGEADARRGWHAVYPAALRALVTQLEADLHVEALNVVVARLSDFEPVNPRAKEGWAALRLDQKAFAAQSNRYAWVDADDLNNLGSKKKPQEDIHYSNKGYKTLGERLALQAARVATGRSPAATGRPEE